MEALQYIAGMQIQLSAVVGELQDVREQQKKVPEKPMAKSREECL